MWAGGKRVAEMEATVKEYPLNLGDRGLSKLGTRHSCQRNLEERHTEAPAVLETKAEQGTYGPIGFFLRLRKNLRALVVVHATWYVKAFLALVRPFIRY